MRLTRFLYDASKVAKSTKRYSNLPDSYIERAMEQVEWKNPDHGPQYVKGKVIKRKHFYFDEHRPWTQEFYRDNMENTFKKYVFVEPIKDWSFFKGDLVEVLVGKDKGKQGLINYIVEERNWVFVEGLNCEYKTFAKKKNFPGMLMKREKPLLVTSDVALVDPSDNKPTQVEWRYTEEGQKMRVSIRSQRELPIPIMDEETVDYKTKSSYKERSKDTKEAHASLRTFVPSQATFQMDLMNKLAIQEDRIPKKSFWYYVPPRA